MNDGSSPEGAVPEHCCRDLGTCQSPMPCEMPVWVGTVPNGCSLLQDTLRVPGERLQAVAASQWGWLESQSGTWGEEKQSPYSLCSSVLIQHSGKMDKGRKMAHYVRTAHTCGRAELKKKKLLIMMPFCVFFLIGVNLEKYSAFIKYSDPFTFSRFVLLQLSAKSILMKFFPPHNSTFSTT